MGRRLISRSLGGGSQIGLSTNCGRDLPEHVARHRELLFAPEQDRSESIKLPSKQELRELEERLQDALEKTSIPVIAQDWSSPPMTSVHPDVNAYGQFCSAQPSYYVRSGGPYAVRLDKRTYDSFPKTPKGFFIVPDISEAKLTRMRGKNGR